MTKKSKKITLFLSFSVVLIIVGFKIIQQPTHEELILGTWVSEGCSSCKWVYDTSGKCTRYYNGSVYKKFSYTINIEKSVNGRLTHRILKLVNISNSENTYEYEVNALGENKMALEYLGGTRKLQYFIRE